MKISHRECETGTRDKRYTRRAPGIRATPAGGSTNLVGGGENPRNGQHGNHSEGHYRKLQRSRPPPVPSTSRQGLGRGAVALRGLERFNRALMIQKQTSMQHHHPCVTAATTVKTPARVLIMVGNRLCSTEASRQRPTPIKGHRKAIQTYTTSQGLFIIASDLCR